jgi:hypothetical protein
MSVLWGAWPLYLFRLMARGGVGGVMADEQQTQHLGADTAWFYHVIGDEESQAMPEEHDLVLDPTKDWCVTHRPASACQCGQYTLEWQEEGD